MIGRVSEIGKKNRYDNVTGLYTESVLRKIITAELKKECIQGMPCL